MHYRTHVHSDQHGCTHTCIYEHANACACNRSMNHTKTHECCNSCVHVNSLYLCAHHTTYMCVLSLPTATTLYAVRVLTPMLGVHQRVQSAPSQLAITALMVPARQTCIDQ